MATPSTSKELAQQALNFLTREGSQRLAAQALGLTRGALEGRLEAAKRYHLKPTVGDPNDPKVLQSTIDRLTSELKQAQAVGSELAVVKAVVGAMSEKVSELCVPTFMIKRENMPSAPGVPTLFLSDWHGGEVVYPAQINGVNQYNVAIMRTRAKKLIESAVHLLKIISPTMDYPGIVLPLGGDMISGNIHEELTATNELNSMASVLELYSILVGIIEELADIFGAVFLPCVTGNHGRDTRKIWNKDRHATSFDWLLYQFLARRFENDKRITFYIPDSADAFYRVYDHAYLLTHGDQFRGGDGMIGCLGPILRGDHKKRSRNAQVDMEYDTMIMGHWHQYIHHGRVIVNGSLKGYDEYAYNNNFGFEQPQQALWLTHRKYGITYRMPVYVAGEREATKTSWVSVPKG